MNRQKTLLISGIIYLGTLVSQGATLVEYDISCRADHKNRHAPSYLDSSLKATELRADGTEFNYSSKWDVDSLVVRANAPVFFESVAVEAGNYMSFVLTADSGCMLDLDALCFGAYPGGGTARAFSVYSSVDNYKSSLLRVDYSADSTGVIPYQIDLSRLKGYKKLSTVEFRLYVLSDVQSQSINLSNISVEGRVRK